MPDDVVIHVSMMYRFQHGPGLYIVSSQTSLSQGKAGYAMGLGRERLFSFHAFQKTYYGSRYKALLLNELISLLFPYVKSSRLRIIIVLPVNNHCDR